MPSQRQTDPECGAKCDVWEGVDVETSKISKVSDSQMLGARLSGWGAVGVGRSKERGELLRRAGCGTA